MKAATKSTKADSFRIMLLAFIARSDGTTGYEIASKLKDPIPLLWPVNHSQIYPVLKALEEDNLLSAEWIDQSGKPNKKIYHLTNAGNLAIDAWLTNLPDTPMSLEQVLVCSYCIGLADSNQIRGKLVTFLDQSVAEIDALKVRYAATELHPNMRYGELEKAFGVSALYRHAIIIRESRIAWVQWILDELDHAD